MDVRPLLERLNVLNTELTGGYRELSDLQSSERQGRLETWIQLYGSGDHNVSSTDRQTDHAVLPLTQDIYKLKAEIQAWQEERDHLRYIIDHV